MRYHNLTSLFIQLATFIILQTQHAMINVHPWMVAWDFFHHLTGIKNVTAMTYGIHKNLSGSFLDTPGLLITTAVLATGTYTYYNWCA